MNKINTVNKKKIRDAINFIEELSWLIESKKKVNLKEITSILNSVANSDISERVSKKYLSENTNKNILVGLLPNLFQDKELFNTNNDLVDFSITILNVTITRSEKRSRYEIIGLIVTEINSLNDRELLSVVEALSILTKNKNKLFQLKKEKKQADFSWNTAIQKISGSN